MSYKSKLERNVAKWLRDHKVKFKYEPKTLPYRQIVPHAKCEKCGCKIVSRQRNYLPDFVLASGRILEAKGNLDTAQRQKFIALMTEGYEVYLIFQSNNKIDKNSKTRYLDWCAKFGINACVFPNIPERWVK